MDKKKEPCLNPHRKTRKGMGVTCACVILSLAGAFPSDAAETRDMEETQGMEEMQDMEETQETEDTEETENTEETAKNVLPSVGAGSLIGESLSEEEYLTIAREAQNAFWGYTNLGIADVSGNLNVRESPSLDGKLAGKMPPGAACEVLDIQDDWAHIQSGKVEGYVKIHAADDPEAVYLLTGPDARMKAKELADTVVRVTADGVRIREEASLDGAVITQALEGEELEFVENLGDWVRISMDNEDAYVNAEYVEIEEKLETAVTMTELAYGEGVSDVRADLVEYAKQFLGNPYVWGGTSLTKGADCSGFVQSIFKHFGISLSRTSRAQAGDGTKISSSELLPGDLIFYANSRGTVNHVAIYIGNGQVIHASSRKTGIKISNYKYRSPAKYIRVIKD